MVNGAKQDARPTIAMVCGWMRGEGNVKILEGIRFRLRDRARVVSVMTGAMGTEGNVLYDFINARNFDGIILLTYTLTGNRPDEDMVKQIADMEGVPIVSVLVPLSGHPYIHRDPYDMGYHAVSHLIEEHNRSHIAFIHNGLHLEITARRYQGYLDALKHHDIPVDERLVLEYVDEENAVRELCDIRRVAVDGMVSVTDDMLVNMMRVLHGRGSRIPEDISAVGCDENPESRQSTIPITTYRPPHFDIGIAAADLILRQMRGELVQQCTDVAPLFIRRHSCGCPYLGNVHRQDDHAVEMAESWQASQREACDEISELLLEPDLRPSAVHASASMLVEAYLSDLTGQTSGHLISTALVIAENLNATVHTLFSWRIVLERLRGWALPVPPDEAMVARREQLLSEFDCLIRSMQDLSVMRASAKLFYLHENMDILRLRIGTSGSLADIIQSFFDCFWRLGIDHWCYCAYVDVAASPRMARFIAGGHGDEMIIKLDEDIRFPLADMLPRDVMGIASFPDMVILPVHCEEEQYGYLAVQLGSYNGVQYDYLRSDLGRAFKRAELMEALERQNVRLEQQTAELEQQAEEMAQQTEELYHMNTQLQREIEQRKLAEEQLAFMAFHDPLTGLANRALFQDRLTQVAARAARRDDYVYAVLYLDLDHFKAVNDRYGHDAGDALLRAVAERLSACVRPGDTVARLGGDEFTILLDDLHSVSDPISIANRILEVVRQPIALEQTEMTTAASLGIALSTSAMEHPGDMLRLADAAMYQAKLAGKARFHLHDAETYAYITDLLRADAEMRAGLDRQEFAVYYQPIIDLREERIWGFEALARWRHPTRGLLQPVEFIGAAEESGFIIPLGRWVMREACRQMRAWQADPPELAGSHICVNVSPREFGQADFLDAIRSALADAHLPDHQMILEIPESALAGLPRAQLTTLSQLRALGIQCHIDRYGLGATSLHKLCVVPVDSLKIDRYFIWHLGERANPSIDQVRSLLGTAGDLGLSVMAAGVETEEQLRQVRVLGFRYAQGHFLAPPLRSNEVEDYARAAPSWLDRSTDLASLSTP